MFNIMSDKRSTEEAIDFILKYNFEYAPKRTLYGYLHQMALASDKSKTASEYSKACSEITPQNASSYQISQETENDMLAIFEAALNEYPDSRWKSASVCLNKIKSSRFPKGNGLLAVAIRCAIVTGDDKLLKYILKNGYNTAYSFKDAAADDGTALMWMAVSGHTDCVKSLIAAKADVNFKAACGYTSLMGAADNGHAEIVEALIAAKAKLNEKDKDGDTALMLAIIEDNSDCIKVLIEAGANVDMINNDGDSALLIAAKNGHPQYLNWLISAKANLNVKDKNGNTALMLAIMKKNTDCVKVLIAAGANVDMMNNSGDTALLIAAANGQTEYLNWLINAKANLNAKGKDGDVALLRAIKSKNLECAKALIAAKADVNAKQKEGWTALMFAAGDGLTEGVIALIKAKADINLKQNSGKSALWLAARNGRNECTRALIAANAYINAKDNDGWTALMAAARYGHSECVKALIAVNADVNICKNNGWTALSLAAANGHIDIVKALVAANAQIETKDNDGMTPLMSSAHFGQLESVKVLLEYGANWKVKNLKGSTAENLAVNKNYVHIAQILAELRLKEESRFALWRKFYDVSNYVVCSAVMGWSIWSIYEKFHHVNFFTDVIGCYIIGCLCPLIAKAMSTHEVADKPKTALLNVLHTVVDGLCAFALCIPILSYKTLDELRPDSWGVYVWVSILTHIIAFSVFGKMSEGEKFITQFWFKLATALILLYLGGAVMTDGSNFVENVLYAFTLGY